MKYDFDVACLEPKTLCSWLGIKGNYLGHEVAVTIGHPTEPPEKRGQAAAYSSRDALLIAFGRSLISMGITPTRVRKCVAAVKNKWSVIEPVSVDADAGRSEPQEEDYFLVAYEEPSDGFHADVLPREKAHIEAGFVIPDPRLRPRLIQNMTAFAAAMSGDLLRYMTKVGRALAVKE